MTPGQRCDEIIRLIDEVLRNTGEAGRPRGAAALLDEALPARRLEPLAEVRS